MNRRVGGPNLNTENPPKKTVLVVDDEELVRNVTRLMLERIGYIVLAAADGVEALELVGQRTGPIDMALVDLTMPRKGGLETFRELKAEIPELPVVLVSGYAVDDARERFAGEGLPDSSRSRSRSRLSAPC